MILKLDEIVEKIINDKINLKIKKSNEITHLFFSPNEPEFNLINLDLICLNINKKYLSFEHSQISENEGLIYLPWGIKTIKNQRYYSHYFPSENILENSFNSNTYLKPLTQKELERFSKMLKLKLIK